MAFTVSSNTVARLLHQMGYSLRVNHKKIPTDSSPDRDQQFLYISELRQRFHKRGLPIISVDTKKRELIGNFKNSGACWGATPTLVNDHDFRSDATGNASLLSLGHSYIGDCPELLADLYYLIAKGLGTKDRHGLNPSSFSSMPATMKSLFPPIPHQFLY